MLTFLLICFIFFVFYKALKKDKHNVYADEKKIMSIPAFSVQAKPMSTVSRVLNLAFSDKNNLDYFSFTPNGYVVLRMANGNVMSDHLRNMHVDFVKYHGMIQYEVKGGGKKFSFMKINNFSDNEWDAISGVLVLAGSTRGKDIFGRKYKSMEFISKAIRLIS